MGRALCAKGSRVLVGKRKPSTRCADGAILYFGISLSTICLVPLFRFLQTFLSPVNHVDSMGHL